MDRRLTRVGAATAAAALALCAGAAQAQDRPARIGDQPNLNGVWQVLNSADWNLEAHSASAYKDFDVQLGSFAGVPPGLSVVSTGEIPYKPAAVARRDANAASAPEEDPEAKCFLPGIPRATYAPYPFQIIQDGQGDMLFVYEYAATNRVIHMLEHNEPPIDTWMGLSNGSWDGDTLVVETTGFNGQSWLDRAGNYAGAGATVTERFTPIDADHIQYEATIENPDVFTQAWTISMPLYRRIEPNAELLEYRCVPFAEQMMYRDLKPEGAE